MCESSKEKLTLAKQTQIVIVSLTYLESACTENKESSLQVVDLEPVLDKEGEEDAGCSGPAQTESVGRASPLLEIPEKYKSIKTKVASKQSRVSNGRWGAPCD